jgi:hypothetical protein
MKEYKISFKVPYQEVQSVKFHPLSTNGPYIDAHFGPLNKDTPVGQTYFIRPVTTYTPPCIHGLKQGCGCGGKGSGCLTIKSMKCYPSVHANDNTVSTDFAVAGVAKISPFEWVDNKAKVFPDQMLDVDFTVYNDTGATMQGLHIHDGQNKKGLTSFGPISYFMYTTADWNNLYNETDKSVNFAKKYAPLPPQNVAPANPKSLLEFSKSVKIKK